MNIMTKRGSASNVDIYEHYCDSISDLPNIPKEQITSIDIEITENDIQMVLADEGPGIDNIELAMKEGYSTAPDNIRTLGFGAGMGLPNIKKYTDGFRIETEVGVGTTLFLKVNLA